MRQQIVKVIVTTALLVILSLTVSAVKAQEPISLQEAISVAQALYPNAQVIKTEFAKTATPPYYIIGLDNGKSVFINALTREIIQITAAQAPSVAGVTPPTAPLMPIVPSAGTLISFEQASRIAQERFPNTQVLDAKLERKGKRHGFTTVWEITLSNGYEVYINAANGAILEIKFKRHLPVVFSAASVAISQAQAEQTAISSFGGNALFSRLKQEGKKDGYAVVWEVFLSNGYKVKVNANTGTIVKVDYQR